MVNEWPEIFEDLYISTMPMAYLDYIYLKFTNGIVWQIDVKDRLKIDSLENIADKILETLQEHKEDIKGINFKIDIDRLKKDISLQTKSLFDF